MSEPEPLNTIGKRVRVHGADIPGTVTALEGEFGTVLVVKLDDGRTVRTGAAWAKSTDEPPPEQPTT